MFSMALSALAVLFVSELGARFVDASLPEPVEWYDARAQIKVEQMDRLARRDSGTDFVFIGTSMVFRGIVPRVFDAAGGKSNTLSYNAALLAGVPPVMKRWTLEEVVPRLRPRVVVYGLSSLDFQGRRYKRPVRAYENAPATRRGVMATLQRVASRHLKLVRRRAEIRDPRNLDEVRDALAREGRAEGAVEKHRRTMTKAGYQPKKWRAVNDEERDRLRRRVLRGYSISARGTRDVAGLVAGLRARQIKVVLVDMPVPRRLIPLHPGGRDDYRRARRHLRDLAARLDVPLVDMARTMHDSRFVDFTHLTEEGAEEFTRRLRTRLAREGF